MGFVVGAVVGAVVGFVVGAVVAAAVCIEEGAWVTVGAEVTLDPCVSAGLVAVVSFVAWVAIVVTVVESPGREVALVVNV